MSLRIQNNIEAFNTHRQLQVSSDAASKLMEKLSSGYRINRAADDAAGLAISEKMRGQIGGLDQAQRNAQDGVSLVQTAEGSLNEVHSMLQRVRDLKTQFDNGTLSSSDQDAIAAEVSQIGQELGNIASQTSFNGNKLLTGSQFTFQVGANTGETVSVTTKDITASATSAGMSKLAAVSTKAGGAATTDAEATTAFDALSLDNIDEAINSISSLRGTFGAVQNRLDHRLNNLSTYQENLVASESRIKDVDMASEMVNFSKLQILQQAGTSMLAQANQAPQSVLSLLR